MKNDEALRILNHEAHYEERIVNDLSVFLISSIDKADDLNEEEKGEVKRVLRIIVDDSKMHEKKFRELMDMIVKESMEEC